MRPSRLVIAAGLSICAFSRAQVVSPAVAVQPDNEDAPRWWTETAVGVSATNPARLIAAIVQRAPTNVVLYSISTNYGQTWTRPAAFTPVPLAPCYTLTLSSDPGVASDSAGNLILSATSYEDHITEGIFLGRMPADQSMLTDYSPATPCEGSSGPIDGDRSRLVFGPGPNNTAEWGLLGYYNAVPCGVPPVGRTIAMGLRTIPGTILGKDWDAPARIAHNLTAPCDPGAEYSRAVHPAIIPRGTARGDAVVIRPDPGEDTTHTDAFASVAFYSHDRGVTWQQDDVALTTLDHYWPPGAQEPRLIDRFRPSSPGVSGGFSSDLAPDPAHDNTVYGVVDGHAIEDTQYPDNTDLFLFRSTDGGRTFPMEQRLWLTDDLLGGSPTAPPNSQQFDVAICVDAFGGVNLLYYQVNGGGPTDQADVRAYYVRLTNYNAQNPTQMGRFVAALSPWFHIPALGAPSGQAGNSVGDYSWIATSGCYVYACFMSTQSGTYNFYVVRIALPECPRAVADFNLDGAVNVADPGGYIAAFGAADPKADMDNNQAINLQDFSAYMAAYAAASTGP